MAEGASKRKLSSAEKFLEQRKRKTNTATQEQAEVDVREQKFAKIKENPFHKILFDEKMTPQEKQEAYAKVLSAAKDKSKKEYREMRKASQELKDWLSEQNKIAAKELIRISDTEAFAELQNVLNEMNDSLLNFENMIGPLIQIIKDIHKLNIESGGQMYAVFKEIKEDEAENARIEAEKAKLQQDVERLEQDRIRLQGDKNAALEDKPWYLFGKTRQSSVEQAARIDAQIQAVNDQISDRNDEYQNLKSDRETQFEHLAAEKERLSEFLNLSAGENVERQKKLVKAALNFVETMDKKSASVLHKMEELGEHIEKVDDMNGRMQRAHKVINGAEVDAAKMSVDLAEEFNAEVAKVDPDSLQAMELNTKIADIDEHVRVLNDAAKSTQKTSLKLTEEATTIMGLKDNNRRQQRTANEMNTSGTASVANRLVSTLVSFSSAANNEAKTTLVNTMKEIDGMTRDIQREDVIQAAAGAHIENDELAELIQELVETGNVGEESLEIQRAAIETSRNLSREANETMSRLREIQNEMKGLGREAVKGGLAEEGQEAASEQDNKKPDAPDFKAEEFNI